MNNRTKLFETERLILRRVELTDAENMFNNYCNSDTVTEYLNWNTHKSIEDTIEYLKNVALPKFPLEP